MCAEISITGFYFDSKDGLVVLEHHEINLSLIDVSQESKLHLMTFDILLIMTKFQKLRGDKIFKTISPVRYVRPIPKIEFLLLLDGANFRR